MASELGLDELRAHSLSTRGFARVMTGDLEGVRDLGESVDIAVAANSPQAARGLNNLASVSATSGTPNAYELYGEARPRPRRRDRAWLARSRAPVRALLARGMGRGARALRGLTAAADDESASVRELDARLSARRSSTRARGRAGARGLRGRRRAGAGGRRAADAPPRPRLPRARAGRRGRATESGQAADEVGALARRGARAVAGLVLAGRPRLRPGRPRPRGGARPRGRRARTRTRWLEAAEAIGEGDWARAADAFAEIGSLPDEAAARVEAAGHQRMQTSSFGGRAPLSDRRGARPR